MAFKQVTDLSTDVTISLGGTNRKTNKKNPTSIEGYYLGKREVADKKKKSGFSYIYTFQTDKGNIGVWGKTDLDRKMSAVKPGTMTRASFDKMVPTPNGDMYKFIVAVDEDNTTEVLSEAVQSDTGGYDKRYASSDEEPAISAYEDESEDDDSDDDIEAQLAARAASKAKVNALLNKGKTK